MIEYPYVVWRLVDVSCYEVHDTLECAFNILRLQMRTLKCLMRTVKIMLRIAQKSLPHAHFKKI